MNLIIYSINFENAFLYAFSTVPQVIAAVIALLAVFLLFKMQSIKNSILGFGQQTIDDFEHQYTLQDIKDKEISDCINRLKHAITREDVETAASQVAGIISVLKNVNPEKVEQSRRHLFQPLKKTIEHNNEIQFNCLRVQKALTQKSKSILIHTILIITSSLLLIPFIPILCHCWNTILIFIVFLILIVWLILLLKKVYDVINIAFVRNY